jgi:hypothetical protein
MLVAVDVNIFLTLKKTLIKSSLKKKRVFNSRKDGELSGKIYKIVDSNKCYIGSACEPTLARRQAKHASD